MSYIKLDIQLGNEKGRKIDWAFIELRNMIVISFQFFYKYFSQLTVMTIKEVYDIYEVMERYRKHIFRHFLSSIRFILYFRDVAGRKNNYDGIFFFTNVRLIKTLSRIFR